MATSPGPGPDLIRTKELIGRDVLDTNGDKVGSIRDILFEREAGTFRFFEIALGVFRKQVLVPVDRVDWGEKAFVLRSLSATAVSRLPEYDSTVPLTDEVLAELERAYPSFYADPMSLPPLDGREPQLVPLRETRDFRIPREEFDLRGWNVFGADGERLGKVDDLLIDPAAMKVAFLSVDVLDDLFRLKDDRHVIVPTEAVDLRPRGRDVWVAGRSAEEIARLPAYAGGQVDPVVWYRVTEAFRDIEKVRWRADSSDTRVHDPETPPEHGDEMRVATAEEMEPQPAPDEELERSGERFMDQSVEREVRR